MTRLLLSLAFVLLASPAFAAYKAGVASKSADDYKKALPLLQASDAMNPSANAKFLTAVAAFQALGVIAPELQKSHECADYRAANDLLTLVNVNMPAGGSVSPEAAKQILGAVPQYQAFIEGSIKRYCK